MGSLQSQASRLVDDSASAPECAFCPTRRVCTARDLTGDKLAALTGSVVTSMPMQRNTFLYRMGEPAKGCFVVRSGVFETMALTSNGDEHVTGFYYPGELIGFSGQATGEFNDTAVALTSSTACRISISNFPDLFAIGAGSSLLRLIAEREETDRLLQINLRQSRAA